VNRKPMAATDGSQLAAYSLQPSNSEPSAVSRKPMANPDGQVYEQFLGRVIRLTPSHQAKIEERSQGSVPTLALDRPSVPCGLSSMAFEPRPALAELET